jgi:hypothetical protein|tara:strand:+ start:315 stop:515 length:201 start_codon:yes stop_codon:yes gene_type:complete
MDSNSREAQDWLRRHLDMLKDGGQWFIPRSYALVTINKAAKTYTMRGGEDLPTREVFAAIGWSERK